MFSLLLGGGALFVVGGAFLFVACIAAGFVLSIVGFFMSRKYAGVAAHAIGGLILNSFMTLMIFAMLHAMSTAREAAINNHEQQIIQK